MHTFRSVFGGFLAIAAFQALAVSAAFAESNAQTVRSVEQIAGAVQGAKPGTVIQLAPGSYRLAGPLVLTAHGTEQQPVVLRAQKVGSVKFTGKGPLKIVGSDWLTVEGMELIHDAQTFEVQGSNHVRLTRLHLAYVPTKAVAQGRRIPWIWLHDGVGHRVDHSEIGPHTGGLGVTLLIDNATKDVRVDHNYFHDRPRDGRNGAETIRVGAGQGSRLNATIENNLFENCDGEAEVISIKSSGITVRNNTFRNNEGQVVVRIGDDAVIEGNQFIADGTDKPVGGVRVHGAHIRVKGNYFQDMTMPVLSTGIGSKRAGAESDQAQGQLTGEDFAGYWQSVGVEFADNLVVDSDAADNAQSAKPRAQPVIQLQLPRKTAPSPDELPPSGWTLADNVFVTQGPLVGPGNETNFNWRGNTVWDGSGDADVGRDLTAAQVGRADPQVARDQGVWRMGKPGKGPSQLPPGQAKKVASSASSTSSAPPTLTFPAPLTSAQVGPQADQ